MCHKEYFNTISMKFQ